jgi:hypothetical protein
VIVTGSAHRLRLGQRFAKKSGAVKAEAALAKADFSDIGKYINIHRHQASA